MKIKYIWNTLLFLGLFTMVSCGEEFDFLRNATPAKNGARIKLFHAAPDVPGVVASINDKVVSGVLTTVGAPGLVTYGSLFPIIDYAVIPSGTAKLKVTVPAGATTPEVNLSTDLNLADNTYYTVHALGIGGKYEFFVSQDDLSIPDAEKTYIRFMSALTDAPAAGIEFLVNNVVTADYTGRSTGKENFQAFEQTGSTRFTIIIREKGKTAALSTLSNLNLVKGKKYTIIARGSNASAMATQKPVIGLVSNN
jgi:hypothetical protein